MKRILVVVDMQNDFIIGSLGSEEAKKIVDASLEKIIAYKQAQDEVIYTRDTHMKDYLHTREGSHLPVEHCLKGTWGWKLHEAIEQTREAHTKVFDKLTFGSIELGEYINNFYKLDKDLEIEFIGLCTDICVISNVLLVKAFCPEAKISVDANCCAGVTVESHNNALNAMKMCQIEII